jgi:chromosome segregation protein
MIKDFSTVYWGYLPATKEPYKAHEKVNAFIGPSGHGKTTIWDGLRLMLGASHFESKRTFSFYVHKNSNWAVVRVAFYNLPIKGVRPFEIVRKFKDEVTACCRIYKNDQGSWARDYYLFDGFFYDLNDLQFNTKAYSEAALTVGQYLEVLEKCLGITKEFRNLMAMSPDTVRDVVNSSPHSLFNLIFDLKGAKGYKQRYDDSKQRLNEQEIEVQRAEKEMAEAEARFKTTKERAQKFRFYQAKEREVEEVNIKLKKLEYFEAEKALNSTIDEMKEAERLGRIEAEKVNEFSVKVSEKQSEIDNLEMEYKGLSEEEEQITKDITGYEVKKSKLSEQANTHEKEIQEIETFTPQGIEELEQLKVLLLEEIERKNLDILSLKKECAQLNDKLDNLSKNFSPYRGDAIEFRKALESANIPFIMLADAINVREDMKKWQNSIEAYLGNNRYRIIVDEKNFLTAKKLQESYKYGARVCLPKSENKRLIQKDLQYRSIYSTLEISYPDKIGGYLDSLKYVYLVDTVEQGHSLQKQGIDSITLQGLLQDNDGAIHLKYYTLCCGKLAIEEEKSRTTTLLKQQLDVLKELENSMQDSQSELREIEESINNQKLLAKLPELQQTYENEIDEVRRLSDLIQEVTNKKDTLKEKVKMVIDKKFEAGKENAAFALYEKQSYENVSKYKKQYDTLQVKIVTFESLLNQAAEGVKALGLSEDDIAFISYDIESKSFQDDSGRLLTSKEMSSKLNLLRLEKEKLYDPSVNEEIVRLVEAQEGQVELLNENLRRLKEDRNELEQTCNDLLFQFRGHIKEIMKDYITEFESFADLLKASAKGRLVEITPEPETWEIQLFIGYDGKEPVAVDGPHLSSGQKASTSLMILLAALGDNRNGKITPIMFLDEPKARVDDDRGNEIGQLLQVTDIQYFITHQQGESLKTIDWIDHAFTCSACEPGKDFANPLILKKRARRNQ